MKMAYKAVPDLYLRIRFWNVPASAEEIIIGATVVDCFSTNQSLAINPGVLCECERRINHEQV
jgi:hypothetical protein